MASLRLAALLALTLGTGGCAVSGHLGSLFSRDGGDTAQSRTGEEVTGSMAGLHGRAVVAQTSETDLMFARLAIVEVLGRGSKDLSVPWENPASGARGTVTPIATAYTRDGATCHDFLASYLRQGAETWLQGEACRVTKGRWEVKSLKPWTRS